MTVVQFGKHFSNWRITSSQECQTKYGVQVGQGIKLHQNTGTSLFVQQVDPNSLTFLHCGLSGSDPWLRGAGRD